MNWEKLTAVEFKEAVITSDRVCLLPIGVIEKHGDHLPLGQDIIFIHRLCSDAAKVENAMVFPFYFLGSIEEARHQPGTIALKSELLIEVLENLCDEIGRNGFNKILIVNGHGGNNSFLGHFSKHLLTKEKNYMVMNFFPWTPKMPKIDAVLTAEFDGHAGEDETSCMAYYYPELVKSEIPGSYGASLGRLDEYAELGISSAIQWYSSYPGHLCADQTPGSATKGEKIVKTRIAHLAKVIKLIKNDNTPFELQKKYQQQAKHPVGH